MPFWQSALTIVGVILVLFIVLKLFKVSFRIIWKLLVNALLGGIVLWLFNLIPGVDIPINWLTTILTGFFGIPVAVILLIIGLIR